MWRLPLRSRGRRLQLLNQNMQQPPSADTPPADRPPSFVLTTQCPDTTGIVAAIAGFLASHNCLITAAQHFDDPVANTSFMRAVFHDNGQGMPTLEELDRAFAAQAGARFGMNWKFHALSRHCRTVLAVSKQGHCLNSILHRWSTGTLPIEVVAVVSNHQDLRSLAEWHGVPFHYFPLSDCLLYTSDAADE